MADRTEAEVILESANTPMESDIAGRPVTFLPSGWEMRDHEKLLDRPVRKAGVVHVHDAASLIAYTQLHAARPDGGHAGAAIYCVANFNTGAVELTAVYNDHERDNAGWRDHRAVYAVQNSEEWKRWTTANRKAMPQAEFAMFLEENMKDVASVEGMPNGSQLLELALTMEATQDKRFKSAIRLQSGGVDLTYVDKEDDSTLQKMKVYERFVIGVAPFFNGQPYQLTARLKYKVKDGAVSFWFELIRPDRVVEDATKAEIEKITTATGVEVLFGKIG